MLRKIISAGDTRRTRFHTEDDVFIGWLSVFYETPLVTVQKVRTKLTGARPLVPWWPLPAIREVEKRLRPDMKAIEFGSGSSSIWIAKRVGSLICREHDEHWANVTRRRLEASSIENCDVQHRSGSDYYRLDGVDTYDFAVVDGEYRWKCLSALFQRMNPGGIIYFDNSDSDKDVARYPEYSLGGSHHAQQAVRSIIQSNPKVVCQQIHGMIHGELFAGSGILLTFP